MGRRAVAVAYKVETWRYPALVTQAFDVLHAEGGRFFGLHLHPWLFGMPYRTRYLAEALDHLARRPGVWQATAGDVANHVIANLDVTSPPT